MRAGEHDTPLQHMSAIGAAAQASVPGLYAWGVTVVPCAWARGSPLGAKVLAVAALVFLAAGVAGERRFGHRARVGSLWGFVAASAATWVSAPMGVGPAHVDAARGLAGMLGWGLFAFASAAPVSKAPVEARAPGRASDDPAAVAAPPSRARATFGDWGYVGVGMLGAAAMQAVGWHVAAVERALFVRLVALAAGLTFVGAAVQVALARRLPRSPAPAKQRARRALGPLVALALLAAWGM